MTKWLAYCGPPERIFDLTGRMPKGLITARHEDRHNAWSESVYLTIVLYRSLGPCRMSVRAENRES